MHRFYRRAPAAAGGSPQRWGWLRGLFAAGTLGVLVWRVGTGPFVAGLARVNAGSLAVASGVAVVTTLSCAWRWTVVARGLGVALPLPTAVAAYYRSQFLNVATPGGILGDVDRAVRHGRDVGDTSRGLRSVVWERVAGQVGAGRRGRLCTGPPALAGSTRGPRDRTRGGGGNPGSRRTAGCPALGAARAAGTAARTGRVAGGEGRMGGPSDSGAHPAYAVTSPPRLGRGHVRPRPDFLVATRTAGSGAAPLQVLPLAWSCSSAWGCRAWPGWGPREGIAAWAFSAGGLGAGQGVATAVVYGVMVFVGALPGAVLSLPRRRGQACPERGQWSVAERPYTLLSCCMSLDGYLDGASHRLLQLSNAADFDRVDGERAASDAILVGAATVRNDNPRLLVRSRPTACRPGRTRATTIARQGHPDAGGRSRSACRVLRQRRRREGGLLRPGGARAHSRSPRRRGHRPGCRRRGRAAADQRGPHARGVRRLMVEGGGTVLTQMLTAGLADELQLVVAPFFVGDAGAPRFVGAGLFPWTVARRAPLAEVRPDRRRRAAEVCIVITVHEAVREFSGCCSHPQPRFAPRWWCPCAFPTGSRPPPASSPSKASSTAANTWPSVWANARTPCH